MSKSETKKEKVKAEVETKVKAENEKIEVKSSSVGKFDWMKEALENYEKVTKLSKMNISDEEKHFRFMAKNCSGEEAAADSSFE